MVQTVFNYLVFPGFLFSAVVGLLAGWIDRKVTARIQWRVGPPWYQNFVDIVKLSGKDIIIPEGARGTFLWAPYFGLLSVVFVATVVGLVFMHPQAGGFPGDIIVMLYFLIIPAVAVIMGAFASRNPLASVGASREMKLVLGYELPFLLAMIVVIVKSGWAIQLGTILQHQMERGNNLFSWSGMGAFVVALLCMQAKLGAVPFDIAEAEQEIMAGTHIEYSGFLLAVLKVTKACLLYTVPLFLILVFWAKDISIGALIAKYCTILVISILIKNTNPRLRIDQALRFFWGPVLGLAVVAVILSLIGY
jgi:NADH-quinone oxidoreductase subunit H